MQANANRKVKRTSNACVACRQSKIKCSGEEPCANCRRRSVRCRFTDVKSSGLDRRYSQVTHSRKLSVRHRQEPWAQQRGPTERRHTVVGSLPSIDADDKSSGFEFASLPSVQGIIGEHNIWTYPFTLPSTTVINTHNNTRRWIWLAPTSPWSFTTRLSLLVTDKLNLGTSPFSAPNFATGPVYSLQWTTGSAVNGPPDVSGLPSLADAKYLFNTVKFHIGQIYHLLDESAFIAELECFYLNDDPVGVPGGSRLWFVQFLLIIALGKGLLSQAKNQSDPPGARFFTRAMSLMPDHGEMWKSSLMAIDVLCLAALYLYSIDHRESANVYVSQAIRIAQMEGLHTQLPEEHIGAETVRRCLNLWWTLYMMDRHFSSSLGIPMTIQDNDITALSESGSTALQQDPTLALQVQLWHLLSKIIATVYKSERTSINQFLEATRSILQTLAGHVEEIGKLVDVDLQNSLETMSRGTRHIALLYHMCVIFATRPLLLSVLIELLDLDGERTAWQGLLALTEPLVAIGVKSAVKTIEILRGEDSVLEAFLPFDLEFLYGAALHLLIASAVFPGIASSQPCNFRDSHLIFDELVRKGNRVAEARVSQLIFLETAFEEFATRAKQQGLQMPCWSGAPVDAWTDVATIIADPAQEHQRHTERQGQHAMQDWGGDMSFPADVANFDGMPLSAGEDSQLSDNAQFLDNIGISANDFLDIVDSIGGMEYDGFAELSV